MRSQPKQPQTKPPPHLLVPDAQPNGKPVYHTAEFQKKLALSFKKPVPLPKFVPKVLVARPFKLPVKASPKAAPSSTAVLQPVVDPVLQAETGEDPKEELSEGEEKQNTLVLYLDEVPMPLRPAVPPSPTDREVFVDPLPDDMDTTNWAKEAFGEVEEVHELPARAGAGRRGYILFCSAEAAARCVAASPSASWSESERAVSALWSTRRRTVSTRSAYPEPLVALIVGEGGAGMQGIKDRTGLEQLHMFVGSVGASSEEATDGRASFVAKGTIVQLNAFMAEAEEQLMQAHQALGEFLDDPEVHGVFDEGPCKVIVRGVPPEWSLDEVKELFAQHGDALVAEPCEEPLRSFVVGFKTARGARTAAAKIDATDLGQDDGTLLRCELQNTWGEEDGPDLPELAVVQDLQADAEVQASAIGKPLNASVRLRPIVDEGRLSVFVGNLPYMVELDALREFMGRAGAVTSARLVEDKTTKLFKGYGFVDYVHAHAAAEAVKMLHGEIFRGRPLRVTLAELPLKRRSEALTTRQPVPPAPQYADAQPPAGPPPAAAMDAPPTLWERLIDERTSVQYFWNHGTAETSWTPPNDLGGYWQKVLDRRTGAPYYWNQITSESRWELPVPPPAAAVASAAGPVSQAAARPTQTAAARPSSSDAAPSALPRPRPTSKPEFAMSAESAAPGSAELSGEGRRKRRKFLPTPGIRDED